MHSLHLRLTLAASLVLTAFLGLAGYALDRAFRVSAETAVRERLQAHIYGLLAAADLDRQGDLSLPDSLPEERFQRPGSGLYAQVTQTDGDVMWRSPSQLGHAFPVLPHLTPGNWSFTRLPKPPAHELFVLSFGSAWEVNERSLDLTFTVIEEPQAYAAQVAQFRRSLGTWFGALALGLLVAQGLVLRWGLNPLRRVERDLAAVEAGARETLSGNYPRELRGLTENLNALLKTERGRLARYRDALADLAHSLKTPLAVLRGARHGDDRQDLERLVQEQTERMTQIVDYQLQRAATSGRTTLLMPVAITPLLQRILTSLAKVYAERRLDLHLDAGATLQFRADAADLMELCGNLLDNACKWARTRVVVRAQLVDADGGQALELIIEDDGPGIAPEQRAAVLGRGVRIDSSVPGQGIGLAVARDIVSAYGGKIEIDASPELGGARVRATLHSS
jgi:two-component system, OmpR family, sensor histidine kinase PhoQ